MIRAGRFAALVLAALPAVAQQGQGEGVGGSIEFKVAPFRTPEPEQQPTLVPGVDTRTMAAAVLRQLDKMTGAIETATVAVGSSVRLGRLEIDVRACEAPESGALQGTRVWLAIRDRRDDASTPPAFAGWMFADSPALSALDHRRYDVWLIACTTAAGEAVSGSE